MDALGLVIFLNSLNDGLCCHLLCSGAACGCLRRLEGLGLNKFSLVNRSLIWLLGIVLDDQTKSLFLCMLPINASLNVALLLVDLLAIA